MKYRYPCTGHLGMKGFGSFLEEECTHSRRNLRLFTQELKEHFHLPYLSLVNSGSSANLVAALVMAELVRKKGGKMTAAISAFTFPTTVSALLMAGFSVQVIDVEENGFNIDCDKLAQLAEFPGVVAVTHFLGFPCNIDAIEKLVHSHGSYLLQDACETMGMMVDNRPVIERGDISTWSFYHPHHMSSYGGGAVIMLDKETYTCVDSVVHWGRACTCHIEDVSCKVSEGPAHQFTYERTGVNVELSELNACFGRWQLLNYDKMEQSRKEHYDILEACLKDCKNLHIWSAPDIGCSPFVFPIQMTDGTTVKEAWKRLSSESIEIRTLMGGVTCDQKAFQNRLTYSDVEHARKMAESTFFVGIHQTLSSDDVRYVAKRIGELFG